MANSLRAKLSKLRHDGHITDAEYQAFIKKMDGHDAEIRNKAFNKVIMQLEAEVESSAKFIREYDDSIAQKAYYSGLKHSLEIAKKMKEGAE